MNKTIFGITALGAVAIALVLIFGANNSTVDHNDQKDDNLGPLLPPPTPITEIIAGKPVSDAKEAASKVGYEVKPPSYLPEGYRVQVTNADDKLRIATMLASPSPVTPQTTHSEFFMQQKGVLIFMEKNKPNFDGEKWMSKWAAENSGEFVTINGLKGAVHGIVEGKGFGGEIIQAPPELVFIRDDVLIEVRGMLSTQELIKIAENL